MKQDIEKQVIKIAVVEDDLFFRNSVERYLKNLCQRKETPKLIFEISSYAEAENAIMALENQLDIMILDYNFGTAGGEQLTGEDVLFAVQHECQHCEVILMSGQRDPELIERMKQKGISKFIDKNESNIEVFGKIINQSIQRAIKH